MSDKFSDRLAELWHQSGRDLALGFLRRATNAEQNLAEILAALQFDGVHQHLHTITIGEVFARGAAAHTPRPAQASQVVSVAKKPRRQRRTFEEVQQMRHTLQRALLEEPGSLDTVQLAQILSEKGHEADTVIVNTLLKTLEAEGRILSLGGKPKAWRSVNVSRVLANPVVIRRAQDHMS